MFKQLVSSAGALFLLAAVAHAQDATPGAQKIAANVSPGQLKGACEKGQDAVNVLVRGSFAELQKQTRGAMATSDIPGATRLLMQKCQTMK